MLNSSNEWGTGYRYTFVLINSGKTVSKIFTSRQAANNEMYDLIGKRNLHLKKVYDDKHDKTYICREGAEFHINRV